MLNLLPLDRSLVHDALDALRISPIAVIEKRDHLALTLYGPYDDLEEGSRVPIDSGFGVLSPKRGYIFDGKHAVGWTARFLSGPEDERAFIAVVDETGLSYSTARNYTTGIANKMVARLPDKKIPDLMTVEGYEELAAMADFRWEAQKSRELFTRNAIHTPDFSGAITHYDIALQFVRRFLPQIGFCQSFASDSSEIQEAILDGFLGRMRYRVPVSEIEYRLKRIGEVSSLEAQVNGELSEVAPKLEQMLQAYRDALEGPPLVKQRLGEDSFANVLAAYCNMMKCGFWSYQRVQKFLTMSKSFDYIPWYKND